MNILNVCKVFLHYESFDVQKMSIMSNFAVFLQCGSLVCDQVTFLDPVQTRLAGRNCEVQLRGASADVESIPDGAR
jgi:hypothetical protein